MKKFRVHCGLTDCYYYLKEDDNPKTGETNLIYCTYPERDLTDDNRPCPYYRMDWQKKMKLVQEKIQANEMARLKTQAQSPSQVQPQSPPITESTPPAVAVPPIASSTPAQAAEPKPDESSPLPPPDALFEQNKKTS
ncbi:MAG: hypothetical protein QME64_12175 [bacterium]|nr:hypothetical protein [bacterium]